MKLELLRHPEWSTEESTEGEMFVNDQWECYTLEDVVRQGPKMPGKTAIPEGTYGVIINHSKHFSKDLPLLINVPDFEGVRIHSGNTSNDTEGCILVGQSREKDFIGRSRAAFQMLFGKIRFALDSGEHVTITIKEKA